MNKFRTLNGIRRKYGTKRTVNYLFCYWCNRVDPDDSFHDAIWKCNWYVKSFNEQAVCDHVRLMEANGACIG